MTKKGNECNLIDFAQNVYSQYGEDGIIQEACARLNITNGYFVEFGAWDGRHLSNTYNLYENFGWSGCYIEGDKIKFQALLKNIDAERVLAVNCYVSIDREDSLDKILGRNGIDRDFDILSIDVDSDDLAIWAGINDYSPKIVVIEYNPTIPNTCEYVQPVGRNVGNAPLSLIQLGDTKGYSPFAATKTNLFFMRKDIFDQLRLRRVPTLPELREERGFIFLGFDGSVITTGKLKGNPWHHNAPVLQTFPKFFRYYGKKNFFLDAIRRVYIALLRL